MNAPGNKPLTVYGSWQRHNSRCSLLCVAQKIREAVEGPLSSEWCFHKEASSIYKLLAFFITFDLLIQEYRVACRDRCPEEPPLTQEIEFRLLSVRGDNIMIDKSS